nr:hypothetical protein CFP56_63045 [Quercus suber]
MIVTRPGILTVTTTTEPGQTPYLRTVVTCPSSHCHDRSFSVSLSLWLRFGGVGRWTVVDFNGLDDPSTPSGNMGVDHMHNICYVHWISVSLRVWATIHDRELEHDTPDSRLYGFTSSGNVRHWNKMVKYKREPAIAADEPINP